MKHDSIETILATEEELIPSSGFLSSVMERIQEEAVAPAPIPFPWKRIFPGLVLIAAVLGWGIFELIRHGMPAMDTASVALPPLPAVAPQPLQQAGWVALALGVSLLSWLLSRRLAGRAGLL
jgi:hypothetical protein